MPSTAGTPLTVTHFELSNLPPPLTVVLPSTTLFRSDKIRPPLTALESTSPDPIASVPPEDQVRPLLVAPLSKVSVPPDSRAVPDAMPPDDTNIGRPHVSTPDT